MVGTIEEAVEKAQAPRPKRLESSWQLHFELVSPGTLAVLGRGRAKSTFREPKATWASCPVMRRCCRPCVRASSRCQDGGQKRAHLRARRLCRGQSARPDRARRSGDAVAELHAELLAQQVKDAQEDVADARTMRLAGARRKISIICWRCRARCSSSDHPGM